MGSQGQKGEKGETTLIRVTNTIEKDSGALTEIELNRNPHFLLPNSAVESTDFSFYQPFSETADFHLFSSVYLNFSSQFYSPDKKVSHFSLKENIFTSKCSNGTELVSGDCQWEIFNFKSTSIPCRSTDFQVSKDCGKNDQINCFKKVEVKGEMLSSIDVVTDEGENKTIENPKCRKFDLFPITSLQQSNCNLFLYPFF